MEYYGVCLRPALSQIPSTSLPGHTVNWNRITTVIKPHLYRQGGGFVSLNPHLKYHAPYIYGLPLSQIDEYFTQVVKSNYSNVPTQLVPKHIMQFVHSLSFLPPQTSHPPHLALSLSLPLTPISQLMPWLPWSELCPCKLRKLIVACYCSIIC